MTSLLVRIHQEKLRYKFFILIKKNITFHTICEKKNMVNRINDVILLKTCILRAIFLYFRNIIYILTVYVITYAHKKD
jgi:hypothetical protein